MTRTTSFLVALALASALFLSGCGGKPTSNSSGLPKADSVIQFNEQGVAMLRGRLAGGTSTLTPAGTYDMYLEIAIPVSVDGMRTTLSIPIQMQRDTEISSTQISPTTLREYLIYHPEADAFQAFHTAQNVWLEVAFQKKGDLFEARSVHEVEAPKFSLFQRKPAIHGVFNTNTVSQGTIQGKLVTAQVKGKTASWILHTPVDIQGVKAEVWMELYSARDTEVIRKDQTSLLNLEKLPLGTVEIQFTRRWDQLTAHRITFLFPPN